MSGRLLNAASRLTRAELGQELPHVEAVRAVRIVAAVGAARSCSSSATKIERATRQIVAVGLVAAFGRALGVVGPVVRRGN